MTGTVPPPIVIVLGGLFVFALLLFQVSLGMRWIKIKGPRHWKVHKYVAWSIIGFAVVHALGGVMYMGLLGGGR